MEKNHSWLDVEDKEKDRMKSSYQTSGLNSWLPGGVDVLTRDWGSRFIFGGVGGRGRYGRRNSIGDPLSLVRLWDIQVEM